MRDTNRLLGFPSHPCLRGVYPEQSEGTAIRVNEAHPHPSGGSRRRGSARRGGRGGGHGGTRGY